MHEHEILGLIRDAGSYIAGISQVCRSSFDCKEEWIQPRLNEIESILDKIEEEAKKLIKRL